MHIRILFLLNLVFLAACSSKPVQTTNERFDANRIWRIHVRWKPYLLDEKKAIVQKEFELIARGEDQMKRLEQEIKAHFGDKGFLRWLETSVFPLGNWEELREARIARYKDQTVAVIFAESLKEIETKNWISLDPGHIDFPDPLLRAMQTACNYKSLEAIPKNESLGIEIVLESRKKSPQMLLWNKKVFSEDFLMTKAWSQEQGQRISYRILMVAEKSVARCPNLAKSVLYQPMGIEWGP